MTTLHTQHIEWHTPCCGRRVAAIISTVSPQRLARLIVKAYTTRCLSCRLLDRHAQARAASTASRWG